MHRLRPDSLVKIALAGALALAGVPAEGVAQPAATVIAPERSTITVTAQSDVSVSPDVATINTAIVTTDDVAATATSSNQTIFNTLRTNLGPLGIDAARIRSTFYNVNFVPHPPPPRTGSTPVYPGQRYGYTVSRQLAITVNALDSIGRVIDTIVAAGITGINGVNFSIRDRKPAYDSALAEAMREAQSQAQTVAQAARLHLGSIRQIYVGASQPFNIINAPVPAPPQRIGAASTFLPPSDVDVRASVTVTYNLQP